jgi:hypothetical protein
MYSLWKDVRQQIKLESTSCKCAYEEEEETNYTRGRQLEKDDETQPSHTDTQQNSVEYRTTSD